MRTKPYNYNLPVEPAMFFGRDTDVAALADRLIAPQGDSVALIGGRRMGKTSLLEALVRALDAPADEAPSSLLPVPVFLDLSGEGLTSPLAFFQAVDTAAQVALSRRVTALPAAPPPALPLAPVFRLALDVWNRATMTQCGRRLRLILLLDECEEIVDHPWAADLHAALRALLVGQATRGLFKVVMAGSHHFLSQVRQRGSPLWDVLIYHMLRVLDASATRDLIVQPIGGLLPETVVAAVAAQSGGHPRLTQYLMYHLWEGGLDHATPETVAQIAATFATQGQDFTDWMHGLGERGATVYGALAQTGGPYTEDQLRAALPLPPTDLAQALSALCYHGVVAQEPDGCYCIAGQMFRAWFARRSVLQAQPGRAGNDEQVAAQHNILTAHRRRLNALQLQQAHFGIGVDPAITMEIENLQRQIQDLEQQIIE